MKIMKFFLPKKNREILLSLFEIHLKFLRSALCVGDRKNRGPVEKKEEGIDV